MLKPFFALPPVSPNLRRCVVIGAGIAGCSLAYALAQKGLEVVVIDQVGVAQGASGNHVGVLQPAPSLAFSPPSALATEGYFFTKKLLRSLVAAGHEIPHGFAGSFRVSKTNSERVRTLKLIRDGKLVSLLGLEWKKQFFLGEKCSVSASLEGLFSKEGGWVHPPAFCRALLASSGASLSVPVKVQSYSFDGEVWHLFDERGRCIEKADAVFFAHSYGAKEDSLFQMIPLFQVRGQVALVKATEASEKLALVLSGAGYLTPSFEGLHVLGATYQRGDLCEELRLSEQLNLFASFSSVYPVVAERLCLETLSLSGRVSWRCSSENRLPLVGAVPDFSEGSYYRNCSTESLRRESPVSPSVLSIPGLYMSLAHGSRGLTVAPLAAEALACVVTGKALPIRDCLWEAMHPARFLVRERQRGRL